MSRLESILNNYNQFTENQNSASEEFKTQMDNAREMQQKAETAGDENSLDMMFLHFFGDKIKNFISDKLGLDSDEVDKFTSNPTEYMKNAAKDVLNKASNSIEDELNERGLNPEGVLNRSEQLSRDAVDTLRRRVLDEPFEEDEAEDIDDTTSPDTAIEPDTMEDDEPDAEPLEPALEPTQTPQSIVDNANDTEGFQSAAESLRNMAEDSVGLERGSLSNASGESIARNLESYGDQPRQDIADGIRNLQTKFDASQPESVADDEPTAEPVSTAPFGGVRMPGSEELQARFQSQISTPETASDAGQKLVSDLSDHMSRAGEDDLAGKLDNGTASAQEVTDKLQEQIDDPNDILQRGGTSNRASELLERVQNLQPQPQVPVESQAADEAAQAASEAAADEAADAAISDDLLLAA